MRTSTVELKDGLENQKQEIEKSVTLRALITSDLVAVGSDMKVKALLKEDFTIDMQAAIALMSGNTNALQNVIQNLKLDPIKMMATQGAIAILYSVILPKVIIEFGSFTKSEINSTLVGKLSHTDFTILVNAHNELNTIDENLLTNKNTLDKSSVPLESKPVEN